MPPKKAAAGNQPSKKAEMKKKEKVIEDKTFGLKNKKGAKTQKFVQAVEKQVKFGGQNARQIQLAQEAVSAKTKKKEDEKKKLDELNALLKPVAAKQVVELGVDPKSVLCAFFKQGTCTKGDKCKFSHDASVERKSEKKSIYVDGKTEDESMADWDEEKLNEVIEKKHGEANKTQTDIICKFFIDAVELNKYGWFWQCPNGGQKCMYRHCLPPGFVLNRDRKKDDDKKDQITIEELVERERAKLGYDLPKITLESFIAWKRRKIEERKSAAAKEQDKKRAEYKAGRNIGLSGRDMFTFNPDLVEDGDGMEEGDSVFDSRLREDIQEDDDDEEDFTGDGPELLPGATSSGAGIGHDSAAEKKKKKIREIDFEELARYNETQSSIAAPTVERVRAPGMGEPSAPSVTDSSKQPPPPGDVKSSPGTTTGDNPQPATSMGVITENGVTIDEDLFDDDDDDVDLDDLEEELDDLKL